MEIAHKTAEFVAWIAVNAHENGRVKEPISFERVEVGMDVEYLPDSDVKMARRRGVVVGKSDPLADDQWVQVQFLTTGHVQCDNATDGGAPCMGMPVQQETSNYWNGPRAEPHVVRPESSMRCVGHGAKIELMKAVKGFFEANKMYYSSLWWMYDVHMFADTTNLFANIRSLFETLGKIQSSISHIYRHFKTLVEDDPKRELWGHLENGAFVGTQVMRKMVFDEDNTLDKGVLKALLTILQRQDTVGDFGALHGHYSKWLKTKHNQKLIIIFF